MEVPTTTPTEKPTTDKHAAVSAFGRLNPKLLLVSAMIAALSSVLTFAVCCRWLSFADLLNPLIPGLFTMAHLLAAYGMGVLLWAVVGLPDEAGKHINHWKLVAVLFIVAYHVTAAAGNALSFRLDLMDITEVLWFVKTFFCFFIIFDFIMKDDSPLQEIGLLMFVACIASCPYQLPNGWDIFQWFVDKVSTAAFALELFFFDRNTYKERKRRLTTPG